MVFNEIKNTTNNYLEFKSNLLIITDTIRLYKYANFYQSEGDIYIRSSDTKINRSSMSVCNPRSRRKRWIYCPEVIKLLNIKTRTNVNIALVDESDTSVVYRLSV